LSAIQPLPPVAVAVLVLVLVAVLVPSIGNADEYEDDHEYGYGDEDGGRRGIAPHLGVACVAVDLHGHLNDRMGRGIPP
jgi:hypothetical protein